MLTETQGFFPERSFSAFSPSQAAVPRQKPAGGRQDGPPEAAICSLHQFNPVTRHPTAGVARRELPGTRGHRTRSSGTSPALNRGTSKLDPHFQSAPTRLPKGSPQPNDHPDPPPQPCRRAGLTALLTLLPSRPARAPRPAHPAARSPSRRASRTAPALPAAPPPAPLPSLPPARPAGRPAPGPAPIEPPPR